MTDESKLGLISEISQQLLKVVKHTMGSDVSDELFVAIEGVLGKQWKHNLVLNKLANVRQRPERISIVLADLFKYKDSEFSQKVRAIRELRWISGMGLVESKRTIELAEKSPQIVNLATNDPMLEYTDIDWDMKIIDGIKKLRDYGFTVDFV
jgi:ribosomal protein L7/L12